MEQSARGGGTVVLVNPLTSGAGRPRTFEVDAAFDETATQGRVFDVTAKPLLAKVVSGYNASIICCE